MSGLVQCRDCGSPAILQLLAWRGARLKERVYSIAELPEDATEVFLRNMQSAYCDLTRQSHEVEALINLGVIKQIGCFELPELLCRDIHTYTEPVRHPPWEEILDGDPTWWTYFDR